MGRHASRNWPCFGIVLALFSALAVSAAGENVGESPLDLVRKTAQNEIRSSQDRLKFMFKDLKQTPRGSQTKLIVETTQGTAGMIIAENGHPLDAQKRQAELARVQRFVNDPDELKKKQKQEKDDAERVTRIMKALPDAFLYEENGTEPGREGCGKVGDQLVRLKFRPNPNYSPPTHTEQVLTGMQGTMLIDANRHRLALIDGTLAKDVGFGWGILGHLDQGGKFLVEQGEVGENHWEVSHMQLNFTGKILLFKSLMIKSNEVYSDFRPVPQDLNFAQGVELLKKHEDTVAENRNGS